ncbi:MAG TPA: hypothetical protein VD835_06220 [Pyrinomonadaceae bacterium]|nr:hypothetical protein [Pyrinomonadaceae bacterium]
MRRLIFFLVLMLLLTPSGSGQSDQTKSGDSDLALQKNLLLSDLQGLEIEALKIDKPLAKALAKAEIAAGAWTLDKTWAKKLLREAYELTFPDEVERKRLRSRQLGAALTAPDNSDIARNNVRTRILEIANQDKAFADELVQLGAQELGRMEEHQRYTQLAMGALRAGDTEVASKYTLKAFEAEPTLITAGGIITDIAARDRKAADQLILQYIERLRSTSISLMDQSAIRTFFLLNDLVFNYNSSVYLAFNSRRDDPRYQQIPPPGQAVMRAYVSYVIEAISKLEQREPGSLMRNRGFLLMAGTLLKQYAPDLTPAFSELEQLSRKTGDDASLPTLESMREAAKSRSEKRDKDALDSRRPDDLTINFAISRGDYERARKLIAKLPDGAQKTHLTDAVNMKEAVSLAARGDIVGAERLAEQLTRAVSMLEAYPAIIKRCVADKNETCVTLLGRKAVSQLKRADLTPAAPPAGIPASAVASNREFDPLLSALSKLAMLVAPLDRQLALEVLDEVIAAANASALDTEQGRTGLDAELFRKLGSDDEVRVRQAAETLKDRLRRIVALAAIYEGRVVARAQAQKRRVR